MAADANALVLGRRVRTGEIADGLVSDPVTWASRSALMRALPCVFNADGQGNCDPDPLVVASADGGTRPIHLFCDDGDPRGVSWTWGRVLRYLVHFYLPRHAAVSGEDVLAVTDVYAECGIGTSEPSQADTLGAALCGQPSSVACEATNVLEALLLVADATGCHFGGRTDCDAGRYVTQLVYWSICAGPDKWLYLAANRSYGQTDQAVGASAAEIFAANNMSAGRVTRDRRDAMRVPLIVGGVKKYEMTVGLVPGWEPVEGLDNVAPGDRDQAKATALLPSEVELIGRYTRLIPWFRQYHRDGIDYEVYRDVARKWVLNEHGRYDGARFNRNAPFDDYRPFDFASVCDEHVTTVGAWMRRARRFLPAASVTLDGQPTVWVEYSFDSGQTWYGQSEGIVVLSDECGVFLDCDNPCQVTPEGVWPDEQNLWFALVDQTFRVRVTAVVESDERLVCVGDMGRVAGVVGSPELDVIYEPAQFDFVSTEHTDNVLRLDAPVVQDDRAAMATLVGELSHSDRMPVVHGRPVIPWLDDEYAFGDRILGVRGRGIRFDAAGPVERLPQVVGKVYRVSSGRYETELILG